MEYTKPEGYKRFVTERVKLKDIIETTAPNTIERTKFKLAAPAAKVCRTLGAASFTDFALNRCFANRHAKSVEGVGVAMVI